MRTLAVLSLLCLLAPAALADGARDERPAPGNPRRTPVVEAIEKAAPAVVSIGTTRIVRVRYWDWDFLQGKQQQRSLGSGVIVHPSGYVVTNAHVINQADQILVHLTGEREKEPDIPATLIAADVEHDLALVRLEKPGPYPFVEFGRSDDLMLGEPIIAIGNPFGLGRTVTTGIISALDRTLDVRNAKFTGLIQTDAAVNHGNSGGPLVNALGQWIGVNSAIYSLSGGSDGISFAIPVDTVRQFVVRSLRSARIAGTWLGAEFGEKDGRVVVEKVHAAGPAAKADLAAGAVVAGPRGRDALRFCFDLLEAQRAGRFTFEVAGAGGRTSPVTISFEPPPIERLAWERLGVRCAEVDDELSGRTGYRVGSGLVVLEVKDGGPAQRVGLARGDLLEAIGDARLAAFDDLLTLVLETRKGESREVRLVRPTRSAFGVSFEEWRAKVVVD